MPYLALLSVSLPRYCHVCMYDIALVCLSVCLSDPIELELETESVPQSLPAPKKHCVVTYGIRSLFLHLVKCPLMRTY